ncbi:MAG TPA: YbhB/YbcL family Raf kinase inhibitor-like protein [Myxococcales bacterium]|nr:YbhB/YbcL family Raf kinase inhibitor-like protein [Myxococcales bacterium]
MPLSIASPDFKNHDEMPKKFTHDGKNISPPLTWAGVPAGTKSLALIVDDPDAPDPKAPKRIWTHWIVYNLPPDTRGLPEAVRDGQLPRSAHEGVNDLGGHHYDGPNPPIGRHRYFFKLFALDTVLPDLGHPTKAQLEKAMRGHVLEQAELMATYQKR